MPILLVNALWPSVLAMLIVRFFMPAQHPRLALVTGLALNALILAILYSSYFDFDLRSALTCFYGCGEWTGTIVLQLELGLNLGSILLAVVALGIRPARR